MPPALSIFFASANIICDSSGNCNVGTSYQQQPSRAIGNQGLPQTALGSLTIIPNPIPSGSAQSSVIQANSYGVANQPLSLYFFPYSPIGSGVTNFATSCAEAQSRASTPCSGASADSAGCEISFTANTQSPYACTQKIGATSGYLSSTSCTCQSYVPIGCTPDPNNPANVLCPSTCTKNSDGTISCPINCVTNPDNSVTCTPTGNGGTQSIPYPPEDSCTINTQSMTTSQLPPGQYLYCLLYSSGFSAGGYLDVNPNPNSPIKVSNGGIAVIYPLTASLCNFYTGIMPNA